ncbi:hypothetical protein OV079_14790 [Nannocystis pusilla]|uniref:Uncharacterized protein n=1 Tax=Nannocystis pusilla TaxID=889268 RepID=A0A9X3EPC4_9BACT|nr:hypothetical protein [Nannocystis pusilla]MCY1006795.1 hypothetical protein [Nannocystis pusilla]
MTARRAAAGPSIAAIVRARATRIGAALRTGSWSIARSHAATACLRSASASALGADAAASTSAWAYS